jgi:hypothetical protein
MYPNTTPTDPALHGGYVPYFYQSGLYLRYGQPQTNPSRLTLDGTLPGYDFSSTAPRKSLLDHPQTVEQIIARGYLAIPYAAPETAILTDKGQTSWLGLDDLITQVRRRYEIYQTNMYEIDRAQCSAVNSLFSIEASRGSMPANSKEVYGLNKTLQKLYMLQMDERVRLWQDVSRLRLTLPEAAQSYLSAYRKLSVLGGLGGEWP